MKYIDVNVIYYFLTADPIYGERSKKIIEENNDLSTSSLTVWLLYVLTKLDNILEILEDIGIKILPLTRDILKLAGKISKKYKLDYEDAIHAATMVASNIDIIFSNDKDFDKVDIVRRMF